MLFEISEMLCPTSHLLLFTLILGSKDALVPFLEKSLVRIYLVENQIDVTFEAVRVDEEGAKGL